MSKMKRASTDSASALSLLFVLLVLGPTLDPDWNGISTLKGRIFTSLQLRSGLPGLVPTRAEFPVDPNPFYFPDTASILYDVFGGTDSENCGTEFTVLDNDGQSSIVVGGFTMSKLIASKKLGRE